MSPSNEPNGDFFYALQPRWLHGDRLYRLYVSPTAMAAAYVAGQIYDRRSAAAQLQQLYLVLGPLVGRWLAARERREAIYEGIDPWSADFLAADGRNFRIARSEVVHICVRRNRSLWTVANLGSCQVKLVDGTTRRFIFVGDQEQERIHAMLRAFDPRVEISGTPSAPPKPVPPWLQNLAAYLLLMMLLLFGLLFGATACFGNVNLAESCRFGSLAVINLAVVALVLIIRRRRSGRVAENCPRESPPSDSTPRSGQQ